MNPDEVKARNRKRLDEKREKLNSRPESVKGFIELNKKIAKLTETIANSGIDGATKATKETLDSLNKLSKEIKNTENKDLKKVVSTLEKLVKSIDTMEIKPEVYVEPKVNVPDSKQDFKKIQDGLKDVVKAIKSIEPAATGDNSNLEAEINKVYKAITGLTFPVPNFTLPFKDSNGNPVQVQLDGSGNVPTSGGGGGGGGGTQYTEGDTDTTIVGTAVMWEDTSDTLRAVSAAKPFPVNIVSGSATGTEYTEGDTDATFTGPLVLAEGPTDTAKPLQVDASGNLQTDVVNTVTVDGSGVTQPVSASSLPLPSGASTSANQSTIIGHVDGIEGLLTTIDADTGTLAGAVSGTEMQVDVVSGVQTDALTDTQLRATPVVVDLGANNDVTVTGSVAVTDNGGSLTVDGTVATTVDRAGSPIDLKDTTGYGDALTTGIAAVGPRVYNGTSYDRLRGDATNGVLVNLGSNNDVTVTGAVAVTDNGGSLTVDGTVAATQSGTWNINNVSGTVSLPTGAATAANQSTANSSLSTISTNTAVRGSTSAVTSVAGSATSVQLLAASSTRKEATITNDSTADLYVKLGTTASTTSYTVKLRQDESYITDKYTGRIDGIWSSATGNARITQIT